jgi:hypothetical protein
MDDHGIDFVGGIVLFTAITYILVHAAAEWLANGL